MTKMMKTYAKSYLSLPRRLIRTALFACLLLAPLLSSEARAAITVTRTSSAVFYTHSSIALPNSPRCSYLSFNVTSSTAISDAWVTTGNFAGAPAYLALGGNDSGILHVGPLAAGQTTPAFFYACSSYTGGAVTAAQTYDIKTYSGNPSYGGTLQSTVGFSTTIDDSVIQAAANTVNALWADVNPAILGATATLTIDGDTGTIGCVNPPSTCTGSQAGPIIFSPATFPNWRADTYVVVASNIVLSGGNSATYNNALYIDSLPSAATTHYTATYYFRTASTTSHHHHAIPS